MIFKLACAFQKVYEGEVVRLLSADGKTGALGVIKEKLPKSSEWLILDMSDMKLKKFRRSEFRKKEGVGGQNRKIPMEVSMQNELLPFEPYEIQPAS